MQSYNGMQASLVMCDKAAIRRRGIRALDTQAPGGDLLVGSGVEAWQREASLGSCPAGLDSDSVEWRKYILRAYYSGGTNRYPSRNLAPWGES